MSSKTNAVRLVEQAHISCKEAFYEYDEKDLSGIHAANAIGMDPEQVFKTLVARGERTGINVFCIPVCCELDLKKAAKAVGEKSIAMIHQKELLPLTGYLRGGCSPIGMKKLFPTYIHSDAAALKTISVSAGVRGCQVILAKEALISETRAVLADLCRE